MSADSAKTLVVGFDALDFEYLDRFSDSLPNFAALRDEGVEAPLASTMPPWTGSAWPSMYTGSDPSYHGVYDFFAHDGYPDEATVASRNDVDRPALWNYLSEAGLSSVVLNLPVTHPAEGFDGTLIPGYLATEDTPGSPEGVRSELSEAIGEEYRIYSRAETADDKDEKLAGYLDLIDLRGRAAVELLDDREWDLAVLQVQKTDAAFHNFEDEAKFRKVYEAADEFLGTVRDAVGDDVNVVVCSDHGIGHKSGYAIYVNEILRQHGYVEATPEGEESSLSNVKTELTGEAGGPDEGEPDQADAGGGLLTKAATAAGSGLMRAGISPADVYSAAQRVGLGPVVDAAVPSGVKGAAAEMVDWRASRAYCRSTAELGVRINLDGRESEGVVSPEQYEAVRDEIIEILRSVETPDGEPAFEMVARREEVYDGPYTEDACDVVFVPNGMNHTIGTKLYGRQFVPIDLYDHEREGVFLASGPDIDAAAAVSDLSLTDVAPTAMALLDQPVPERMTGEVPTDLVETDVSRTDYGEISFGTSQGGDGREDEVTERLEDLGYI